MAGIGPLKVKNISGSDNFGLLFLASRESQILVAARAGRPCDVYGTGRRQGRECVVDLLMVPSFLDLRELHSTGLSWAHTKKISSGRMFSK